MRVVCAWCEKELQAGAGPTSHGICAACSQRELEAYYARRLALLEPSSIGTDAPSRVAVEGACA